MNWIIYSIIALFSTSVLAQNRYGQMVFNFDTERAISVKEYTNSSALEVMFSKTSPQELENIDYYDHNLVKRVLVTDLGPSGTKLKIFLQDSNLKATVSEYKEPHRVTIDIFDRNYQTEVDPVTGLPLVAANAPEQPEYEQGYSNTTKRKLADTTGSTKSSATVFRRTSPSSKSGKRTLVAPAAQNKGKSLSSYFKEEVSQIADGRGLSWEKYPAYIYPLQTAIFQGRANPAGFKKSYDTPGLSEGQAMAEYALKLYNFGHEKRALAAYLQVQRKEPIVFDADPLHLWALSEIHFGSGNLTLAEEYYSALISKHRNSALAVLSQLRILDVQALSAMESPDKGKKLAELAKLLPKVNARGNSEIALMKEIRDVYWTRYKTQKTAKDLPLITEDQYDAISKNYTNHEDPKTGFIASSLVMKYLTTVPWSKTSASFAQQYFSTYKSDVEEPYIKSLENTLKETSTTFLES